MADKLAALVLNHFNGDVSARLVLGDIIAEEFSCHPEVNGYVKKLHGSTVLTNKFFYDLLMKFGQRLTRYKLCEELRRSINAQVNQHSTRSRLRQLYRKANHFPFYIENKLKTVLEECAKSRQVVSADS